MISARLAVGRRLTTTTTVVAFGIQNFAGMPTAAVAATFTSSNISYSYNSSNQKQQQLHYFSSKSASSPSSFGRGPGYPRQFKLRRRPPKNYRPFQSKPKLGFHDTWKSQNPSRYVTIGRPQKKYTNSPHLNALDDLDRNYGPFVASSIRALRREAKAEHERAELDPEGKYYDKIEEEIRYADYLTTERGSTEEAITERRMFEHVSPQEKEALIAEMKDKVGLISNRMLDYEDLTYRWDMKEPHKKKNEMSEEMKKLFDGREEEIMYGWGDEDPDNRFDMNRRAHGPWFEYLITVRRGTHNWRGGRIETYRAMMIGGNGNGCAGFGVGQGKTAMQAVEEAGRKTRVNVFFVDRFQNERLTRDLTGRHNSCKAVIRTVHTKRGLHGNRLMCAILARFGIMHGQCKAHGNRHPWSVVYATFKAILSNESIEEIAMKRGERFVKVERAQRTAVW